MDEERIQIDIPAVMRALEKEQGEGEDLDEALLRVCKNLYGENGQAIFSGISRFLKEGAKAKGIAPGEHARRLADGQLPAPSLSTVVTRRYASTGPGSLKDLPPDIRQAVEKHIREGGQSGSVTVTRVTTSAGTVRAESPQPEPVPPSQPLVYQCKHCGHASQTDFTLRPRCGKEKKQSFWNRLLGR